MSVLAAFHAITLAINVLSRYVADILANTSGSVEQVTIEPDGKWFAPGSQNGTRSEPKSASFVDDDDLFVSEVWVKEARGVTTPLRSLAATETPATVSSRESSTPMPRSGSSNKRPAPQVIDLTLSDDDDEEPLERPVKRPHLGTNGWPGVY